LKVGDDFNPEVGFIRRSDFRKTAASARFSPRPGSLETVRKLTWMASLDYFEDGSGRMESRSQEGRFNVEFENSDQLTFQSAQTFERPVRGCHRSRRRARGLHLHRLQGLVQFRASARVVR
jgi:hypothetical protein